MAPAIVFADEPGYRLKLRRAKQHLDFIDGEVREFVEHNLGTPVPMEPKPENEWTILRRGTVEPISPLFGAYFGDVIHNARSALDNLVCAMIRLNDPDHSVEHAYFPAYDGKKQWINQIVDRDRGADRLAPTDGVSADVLAAIEQSQPYHIKGVTMARTPPIRLQAASNTDKHQAIHATTPRVAAHRQIPWLGQTVPPGRFEIVPPGYFKIRKSKTAPLGTPIETGAEIGRLKIATVQEPPPDAEVGVKTLIPLEIAFSVEGKSIEITHWDLWGMVNEAWRAVLRVEAAAGVHGLPAQDA